MWGRMAYEPRCVPPPGRRSNFGGRGDVPSAFGGGGGPAPLWTAGRRGGVGAEGRGGAPWFPASLLRGGGLWPRPSPPSSPAQPPQVYLFGPGRWAAPGPGRGLAGRRWVSLAGGGGGGLPPGGLPRSIFPPSPGGHQGGSLRLCPALHTALAHVRVPPSRCGPQGAFERRRRAASLLRALREWAGGRLRALGVQQRLLRLWHPPLGVAGPSGGGRPTGLVWGGAGLLPPWLAFGCPRAGGREGGRGGGEGGGA